MEKDDRKPNPDSSGNRRPPRPPNRTAVGLGPEGDDSDKNGRATITKVANGAGKFIRHSGGRDHYGHVIVRIEPNVRGKGVVISSDAPAGTIPEQYIKPVMDAVREALDAGVVVDRPIVDIVVSIIGGSW